MLPIKTTVALSPWFREQTLEKADLLLRKNRCPVLFYRHGCAAVFPGQTGYCLITVQNAPQLSQKFRIDHTSCSICGHRQRSGDHCLHVAALAAAILRDVEDILRPVPLLFPDNPIAGLADFMYQYGTDLRISVGNKGQHPDTSSVPICVKNDHYQIDADLPNETYDIISLIFSNNFPKPPATPPIHADSVQNAWQHLFLLCRSTTESKLNDNGSTTRGQALAGSLPTQLCRHFLFNNPAPAWHLQPAPDNSGIYLLAKQKHAPGIRITPRHNHLQSLLKSTSTLDLISVAGNARAYSRIFFQEDDSLLIEPWLELDDGSKHQRQSIQDNVYGSLCFISNLFYKIREQEDNFAAPSSETSLPLLAFANRQNPAAAITIQASDIPAFLDKHLQHILNGRHDVDPTLAGFTINDLPDSVEIIDYNEEADWCCLSARFTCGSRQLDLRDIMAIRRAGQKYATGRGKWLRLRGTPLDWLYELGEERLIQKRDDSVLRLTKLEMMAFTALVPDTILPSDPSHRRRLRDKLSHLRQAELPDADIPSHLRGYQRKGLAWLNHLYSNNIGGILADDMGLGKTHQALALLRLVLRAAGGPALVVCPASVLPHWQDKLDVFYQEINYTVYYGAKRQLKSPPPERIILTTYGIVRQDIGLLSNLTFSLIIFDEIQYLKNHDNATSKAAKHLNGRVRFGLSGTPIENSLTDLKSIYDICLPGLLGSHASFIRTYSVPIEKHHNQRRIEALQRLTRPFMLRRKRGSVLTELPDIIQDNRYCYLSDHQLNLYQQAIDEQGRDLLTAARDTSRPFPHFNFLALVQQLKQICNHPSQLTGSQDYEAYKSGKWELFKEIMEECLEDGIKVVVFSQYTTMLDIIMHYLQDTGVEYTGLRGSTSITERGKSIGAFNKDKNIKVFCASLLAGGTGIDLTGAQAVIHYDRWWNSAREEQATARVHRFGQHRAVQVFKFITKGTVEEKIHRLITKKHDLAADAVRYDDGSIIKKLNRDEITSILQWTPASG